ncbi:hypothetical protein BDR26DRAFT_863516 [Obelidium mucronatum]|nr:hypothetical protein BDR26DRAFT_863516 [Obelidium mucronatum]
MEYKSCQTMRKSVSGVMLAGGGVTAAVTAAAAAAAGSVAGENEWDFLIEGFAVFSSEATGQVVVDVFLVLLLVFAGTRLLAVEEVDVGIFLGIVAVFPVAAVAAAAAAAGDARFCGFPFPVVVAIATVACEIHTFPNTTKSASTFSNNPSTARTKSRVVAIHSVDTTSSSSSTPTSLRFV